MSSSSGRSQDHSADSSRGSAADHGLSPQDSRYVAGEMAQALKEIARGEQTASMLEASLTSLESKLDAMLTAIENPVSKATDKDESERNPKEESKS